MIAIIAISGGRPVPENSIWIGITRGAWCRCPACGLGWLFDGFLRLRATSAICGADNADYPCDDFPPYLTIVAVGHLVVPPLVLIDLRFQPSVWQQAGIWLPATVLLCLLLLPVMKGATAGLCWAVGLIRQQESEPWSARAPVCPRDEQPERRRLIELV